MRLAALAVALLLPLAAAAEPPTFTDKTILQRVEDEFAKVERLRADAERGDAEAQYNLGLRHYHGLFAPQDYAQALQWYEAAAKQGHAAGQFSLGVMHAHGQGGPQDYAQARQWWELAAKQGHASAQYNLGVMYDNGSGVPQNHVQAYAWFNVAAAGGNEGAAKARDLVASEINTEALMRAQELSRAYFEEYGSWQYPQ